MTTRQLAERRVGQSIPRSEIPQMSLEEFRRAIVEADTDRLRVAAYFGDASNVAGAVDLYTVLVDDRRSAWLVGTTTLEADEFPALTPDCPQVHYFEREVAEQFGVRPLGHPWFKPVRCHASYRPGHEVWNQAKALENRGFYRVNSDEVHEVAVGPVHAGIIEPGHFRFQCHGELVLHLEIALGYQHRGIERALRGRPTVRTLHTVETAAGDSSIGHALAYCEAVESLSDCAAPIRAEAIRGVALELERLANHTGDLGALAGDVGFLPTASFCGRIRGDFLNITALLCGSRFGRGVVRPGGIRFDFDALRAQEVLVRLDAALRDVRDAANLLWNSTSVQARFEGVGAIDSKVGRAIGLVGPAARACGLELDVRNDFPSGIFRFAQVPVSTATTGDVFARAYVRWLEIQRSVQFIREQLDALPCGPIAESMPNLKPDQLAISLVEGWRGEICHVALTDAQGRFARYKIVDPSFHNWMGLAVAMRDQQISDFPLCNKSFNLSYCGHDL